MHQTTLCTYCSAPLTGPQRFCSKCGRQQVGPSKTLAVDEAIQFIQGNRKGRLGRKRELKELPKVLWEDERPEQIVTGNYREHSGILVATDRRILFLDKGLLGQVKMTDFRLSSVTSIESSKGLVFGHITIYSAGNRVEFDNILKEEVDDFVMAQRNKLSLLHSSSPAAPVTPPPVKPLAVTAPAQESLSEALTKLGELHRQGVLTDSEFERAKQKLLDGP